MTNRQLGIRPNLGQFLIQTLLVFFVGTTIGLERTVVPLLARDEFGIASASVVASFLVSFGLVKAALNLWGGYWSERWGRRPLLIAGWVAALPIPLLIIVAPSWSWIVAANILMGVNQGLAWSMTVTSKVDIVGEPHRGLAISINEFAGYLGVALASWFSGTLAASYGLRPAPFIVGFGIIVVALGISVLLVKETRDYARLGADAQGKPLETPGLGEMLRLVSWKDRTLLGCSQAGMVGKFVDALVWVAFPLYLSAAGLDAAAIGAVVGVYGLTWATAQLVAGPASDRFGRKPLIIAGMVLAALGVATVTRVEGMAPWLASAVLTGLGIALTYPTLLAAVSDASQPKWRGAALGVYRMWRDAGYAFGGLLIGLLADAVSLQVAFDVVAACALLSAALGVATMQETAPNISPRKT